MNEVGNIIIRLLEDNPGLADGELAEVMQGHGASSKWINQNCNQLKTRGVICRKRREDGLIGNWLNKDGNSNKPARQVDLKTKDEDKSEKKLKQILAKYLTSQNWEPVVAWGSGRRGVDIEAHRGDEHWVIQVKGLDPFRSAMVNNCLLVLGEIIQRMESSGSKYSIALPDLEPYHRFWERLPRLAKSRLQITALFVNLESGVAEEVD